MVCAASWPGWLGELVKCRFDVGIGAFLFFFANSVISAATQGNSDKKLREKVC